tara:strand:- start:53 stop:1246 length:1194 start_codon:yes stop_codon:yes gene_type:complete
MNKYRLVDLFCGAGGLSLGFLQTGQFQVVGAIDNWEPAINTFRHNHPDISGEAIVHGDASMIDSEDFEKTFRMKWESHGPVDVVVGGPPCQGLSLAGKRLSNDSRNQLFRSFVSAVDKLRPKVFVMENVPGLLSMQSGLLNQAIIASFRSIGYKSFAEHMPTILKAEDYGVPQLRRRLFYIGFLDSQVSEHFMWPASTHRSHDHSLDNDSGKQLGFDIETTQSTLLSIPTVEEAISDLPLIASGEGADEMEYPTVQQLSPYQLQMREPKSNNDLKVFNHEAPKHTEKLITMIQSAKLGQSVDPKYTDSKKWDPKKPGFTVKALGSGGGSTNRRAFHYDKRTPRGSTVRENARIQSFPDWYRFYGPKTHQMTQVGNAVPPMLAKAIAKSIYTALDENF